MGGSKFRLGRVQKYTDHSLRTSEKYLGEWKEFLLSTGCGTTSSLFIQFVVHSMFKTLIKAHYCHNKPAVRDDRSQDLSHIEFNAIRYTAGYVPRALKKKLIKSGHKNKKDLLLCLNDLIACDGEDPGPSTEWIYAIDRGGLTHINNLTFELFLTMEYSIQNHILAGSELGDVKVQMKTKDDVLFCWSVLTASWSDGSNHHYP